MSDDAARIVEVVVLHVDGCPGVNPLLDRLDVAGNLAGVIVRPILTVVADERAAVQLGMSGSPTVLIDGLDPFLSNAGPSLGCRLYHSANGFDGAPTVAALTAALLVRSTQHGDG